MEDVVHNGQRLTKPTDHYCAKCKYLANIKEIDLDSEDDS